MDGVIPFLSRGIKCPTCGVEIPSDKLACPKCWEVKGWMMILASQKELVPRIISGDYSLTLRKSAESHIWHIKTHNYEQAWCGKKIHPNWRDRKSVIWQLLLPQETCSACIEMIEKTAKK